MNLKQKNFAACAVFFKNSRKISRLWLAAQTQLFVEDSRRLSLSSEWPLQLSNEKRYNLLTINRKQQKVLNIFQKFLRVLKKFLSPDCLLYSKILLNILATYSSRQNDRCNFLMRKVITYLRWIASNKKLSIKSGIEFYRCHLFCHVKKIFVKIFTTFLQLLAGVTGICRTSELVLLMFSDLQNLFPVQE